MSIGKNIVKFRKMKGLTQEELGLKLGVTNQSVSKWESEVSMPDIMLLPNISSALDVSLEDIYGIEKQQTKVSVSADDFPTLCHEKLIELFYYNTKMKFTHIPLSDNEQLKYLNQKLNDRSRIGCVSNIKGAFVATNDFSFIDCTYKDINNEKVIKSQNYIDNILLNLTDRNLREVFYYQYKTAINNSKEINTEFTFDEIMNGCNLTQEETRSALKLLKDCCINDVYTEKSTQIEKYVFLISNALYAHAIYKLAMILSEKDSSWIAIRDTSMISDYLF